MTPPAERRLAAQLLIVTAISLVCSARDHAQQAVVIPLLRYSVVQVFPHDPHAFTEGLVYDGKLLYESTGLRGQSEVRIIRLETGEVLQRVKLETRYFGEGLAIWRDRLVQLTYQEGIGFLYDRVTLHRRGSFAYRGEGWGLTSDGKRLIASDGSATLRFLDPSSLAEVGHLTVRAGTEPVTNLNELEFVRGQILANIWHTRMIARIDPGTGRVTGWIDLSRIRDEPDPGAMNGIAYDAAADRLFVTGKYWPELFEIRIEGEDDRR